MENILYALIMGCFICLLLLAFAKPLRVALHFFVNSAVGCCALWICHAIGLGLGVNWVTAATVGVLGLPGFVGLMAVSFFL